jgi:hypothetical protein
MLFVEERGYHVLLPRCSLITPQARNLRHWTHQTTPQSDAPQIPLELSHTRLYETR